jgi:hypothetical protein
MHVYKGTNNKPVHNFQLQKSITIYLVYIYIAIKKIDVFFFKLTI